MGLQTKMHATMAGVRAPAGVTHPARTCVAKANVVAALVVVADIAITSVVVAHVAAACTALAQLVSACGACAREADRGTAVERLQGDVRGEACAGCGAPCRACVVSAMLCSGGSAGYAKACPHGALARH